MNSVLQWLDNKLAQLALLKQTAVKEPWVHGVHAAIAFLAVFLGHFLLNKYAAAAIMLSVAAGIEFWFDKKYEQQPFKDNLHDFEDYIIGVLVAMRLL